MQKAKAMFETIPLGQRLRRFRRLQGIKQNHLAQMLGVSQVDVFIILLLALMLGAERLGGTGQEKSL